MGRSIGDSGASAPIHLDLTGLECPIPVLRVRKALYRFPSASVFTVFCDDPLSPRDIESAITSVGATVVGVEQKGGGVLITGRKGG